MSQVCWLLVGKGGFNQLSFGPHLLCQVQTQIIDIGIKIQEVLFLMLKIFSPVFPQ